MGYESCGARWVEQHKGGAVYELHSYVPELKGATIIEKSLTIDQNFTAFHVGMNNDRPGTDTPIPTLKLAGDWVKIPTTAKLLEGACISGMMAANHILRANGMESDTIHCVPNRGMFAGRSKKKKKNSPTKSSK